MWQWLYSLRSLINSVHTLSVIYRVDNEVEWISFTGTGECPPCNEDHTVTPPMHWITPIDLKFLLRHQPWLPQYTMSSPTVTTVTNKCKFVEAMGTKQGCIQFEGKHNNCLVLLQAPVRERTWVLGACSLPFLFYWFTKEQASEWQS